MESSQDPSLTGVTSLITPKDLKPPSHFYHYTSQSGLLGILSSKCLWSTRIQYLNDSSEFVYAQDLWKDNVDGRLKKLSEDKVLPLEFKEKLESILQDFRNFFDRLNKISIYVACFSEVEDSLSQWRGYGRGGAGFNIGFDPRQLMNAAYRQSCAIVPCIYDRNRQVELIDKLFAGVFDKIFFNRPEQGFPIDPHDRYSFGNRLIHDYTVLACAMKHPAFAEEREWRLFTSELPDKHPQIGFRSGKHVPIPYFNFRLTETVEEQLETEIVVGPNPEMALAAESVKALLSAQNCFGSVKSSTVPYREM